MKIRKSLAGGKERKVFIYENKKEEYFMVAVPDVGWSADFTYETENLKEILEKSLYPAAGTMEEAGELAQRIFNWTREM
ncbi:YueH family protein [Bacillus salacetis]|uniref:YueH family protein n=1 Tax=Bacillus salacetis TaxID=2315464 RepID=UPI001F0C1C2F|nr:YueH family protein [Bacillus salacetis]